MELKKDNAKKIKNELDQSKNKVNEFRNTKSRDAIDRKYF